MDELKSSCFNKNTFHIYVIITAFCFIKTKLCLFGTVYHVVGKTRIILQYQRIRSPTVFVRQKSNYFHLRSISSPDYITNAYDRIFFSFYHPRKLDRRLHQYLRRLCFTELDFIWNSDSACICITKYAYILSLLTKTCYSKCITADSTLRNCYWNF